ncbi:MAG: PEGA domain-containing protein [Acidobacteriota bacterium]
MHTEAAGAAPPDAFGPFRILHQVGAGTLGPVFRAFDADRARLVAIKVLQLELAPERLDQLVVELERLIAAGLSHPVVAAPIAIGTNGVVIYLAQEYVSADSLDVVLGDEASLPADAVRVAAQLAAALDVAAAAGIYHGALHPRDVLITEHDTRLTGLGIAGAIEAIGVAAPRRRPYTAPERIAGGAWDRRADVFSLAALLHEMLWGRRVSAIGAAAADALTELPGGDLAGLKTAFARALAFDPAARFATAGGFAAAIGAAFPLVRLAPEHRSSFGDPTDPAASLPTEVSDERPDIADDDPAVELAAYAWEEDATLTMTLDPRYDDQAAIGVPPDAPADAADRREPDLPDDDARTDDDGQRSTEGRLQFDADPDADPEDRDAGNAAESGTVQRLGMEDRLYAGRPAAAGQWDGIDIVSEPADVELRQGDANRGDADVDAIHGDATHGDAIHRDAARYDELEIAPAPAVELAPLAVEMPTAVAASPWAPLSQPPLSPPEWENTPRPQHRNNQEPPARSLFGPLAAVLMVGLLLGFAGGYALGWRPGTPAIAPAPSAAPSSTGPSSTAPASAEPPSAATAPVAPGRGVADVVGETAAVPPTSAPAPRPATEPGRSGEQARSPGEKAAASSATAPATVTGRLVVRSTPPGAQVFVDDQEQGQTPATIRNLSRGTHRVRVTRDGYVPEERRLTITAAQSSPSLTILLKRAAPAAPRSAAPAAAGPAGTRLATLTVVSRPDGASVFLDGLLVGTTPISLPEVEPGQHAVRLERDGYRPWTVSVRMAGGQRQRVAASLER